MKTKRILSALLGLVMVLASDGGVVRQPGILGDVEMYKTISAWHIEPTEVCP